MVEIIPNWHPIFVHFSIGLLSASVFTFLIAGTVLSNNHRWQPAWQHMANGCLWLGAIMTIITVLAGMFAYNTVTHDSTSHAAMTLHRNWAAPTALLFIGLAVVAYQHVRETAPSAPFLIAMVIAGGMLAMTGYLGGEAVYRHGLGVMALPVTNATGDEHQHEHHATPTATLKPPPPPVVIEYGHYPEVVEVAEEVSVESYHDHSAHKH